MKVKVVLPLLLLLSRSLQSCPNLCDPNRRQPTRLRCLCDSPGKNTGVGESTSVKFNSFWPHGLYSPWNSPGQNTGVGSLSLLQGIFPTQVSCTAGGFFTSWATREAQEHWSGQPIPPPADLPDPGTEPGSPASQAGSLPAEPPGKPKNTGVGSLSLLQGVWAGVSCNCKRNDGMCFLFCFFEEADWRI